MSCPHSETTAILATFGEAPPEFEAHLAGCEACRAVLQQHTSTLATLAPLVEKTTNTRRRWSPHAVGFLLVATVLLAFQFTQVSPDASKEQMNSPIHAQTLTPESDLFDDGLDDQLASLELQLDLFYLEES